MILKKLVLLPMAFLFVITGFVACRTTVAVQPKPVVVTRTPSPGVGFIWIDGGWHRSHGHWVQKQGYWVKPKHGRVYVSGRWVKTRNGYYWKKGFWR